MAQEKIKMCTGCGWLNTKPLGLNMYGEPYSACCPDNTYKDVTAVEWLSIILRDSSEELFDGNIFEQAKAMEKGQIKNAWLNGGSTLSAKNAEQYYNETYNTQGSE